MTEIVGHVQRSAAYEDVESMRQPYGPISVTPIPVAPGRVWAITEDAEGDIWWSFDGATIGPDIIFPPDEDADFVWYAGGSDGNNIYHLIASAGSGTGQVYVDKFDGELAVLLDRWEVVGWDTSISGDNHELFPEIQHVCANESRVVVIASRIDVEPPGGHYGDNPSGIRMYQSIDTTVFDTDGVLLAQWSWPVFDLDAFGTRHAVGAVTGSCTDGDFVYFWITSGTGEALMIKIELTTGTVTQLFTEEFVNAQSDGIGDNGFINWGGFVKVEDDLIVCGNDTVARVRQDGTVVWIKRSPNSGSNDPPGEEPFFEFQALAHSGRESVWAAHTPWSVNDRKVEEWTFDGEYMQSIEVIEPLLQAWLAGAITAPRGAISVVNAVQGIRTQTNKFSARQVARG